MRDHLVDKHKLTNRQAHLIANPNDQQAIKAGLPRPTAIQGGGVEPVDFDVLEDF
ncbi:hypothetical protein JQX09_17765 [Sulfitobacter pseudonitzschiae]|uniref:Uncharacterized protein n=2 Tax=Pseudosulfitobacter pseudonitzschiae TaxID=1402135 RepID=A0A9Q2RYM7_9RHOB|nr:hypothetical protein [Pseudosulfitobacter pseudonitzschiae]MBM2313393.1 hypothetical protein [Pseudosulfitobacter pseudonitzschiae]MBM2318306.1 hypothetical protein [Pseudosulfitobacter pseudonitzschiae]MBM2327889.1 hypothetical protein [Pseudosulfitobacter pseudonitzschiae]MBM2337474.1 hypothetical protein [Pseudosulfitobacter pseudonitzschiae]